MSILIDPPTWPAHGTEWSHVVSDSSLEELHRFASALRLPRRSFDLDHYDLPAARYADAVATGALPTNGRELSRRLAGSGLRVPGRSRPVLKALRKRWLELAPDEYEMGDDLLVRWREPHRVYHGPQHLAETLDAAERLLMADPSPTATLTTDTTRRRQEQDHRVVGLALWFHDAVHAGSAGKDEADSADLATAMLADLGGDDAPAPWIAHEVARLVLVTVDHSPGSGDALAARVSDADLAILAADPVRYAEYTRQVRAEYVQVPDHAFRTGRGAVLEQLLSLDSLYLTPYARGHWQERAVANLRAELATLHE